MIYSKFYLVLLFLMFTAAAQACDLCGCYNPPLESNANKLHAQEHFNIYAGIAEQFTSFGTDRLNGEKVANPIGEYFNSSITQFVLGAAFWKDRLSLQANIPLIYRTFRRPSGFEIEHGTVSGLGDISLSVNFLVLRKEALFHGATAELAEDGKSVVTAQAEPDFSATAGLSAGLKLPTGDPGQLGVPEVDVEGAPASGIGGHDLTLGTGSVDGIFGAQALIRYKALFFQADAQFAWRGLGAFSYRFANDFSWSGGPGVYLLRKKSKSLAVQFVMSGETKGYDEQLGEIETDTGITSLYLGPRILGSFGRFIGEIGVDLPVIMNTTAFQTTPDFRIRAAITYRF